MATLIEPCAECVHNPKWGTCPRLLSCDAWNAYYEATRYEFYHPLKTRPREVAADQQKLFDST